MAEIQKVEGEEISEVVRTIILKGVQEVRVIFDMLLAKPSPEQMNYPN